MCVTAFRREVMQQMIKTERPEEVPDSQQPREGVQQRLAFASNVGQNMQTAQPNRELNGALPASASRRGGACEAENRCSKIVKFT